MTKKYGHNLHKVVHENTVTGLSTAASVRALSIRIHSRIAGTFLDRVASRELRERALRILIDHGIDLALISLIGANDVKHRASGDDA